MQQQHQKPKPFTIIIDADLLRRYPYLTNLPAAVSRDNVNTFLNQLSYKTITWSIYLDTIRLSSTSSARDSIGRTDYLGIEHLSSFAQDIADVIREETGVDPRKNLVYSQKGSVYKIHQDELIRPFLRRSSFNPVSSEEVLLRRKLAESGWNKRRFNERQREERKTGSEGTDEVRDFFFAHRKR